MMSGVVFLILVALAFLNVCDGDNNFPTRYCIDPLCSGPISVVRGLHAFNSGDREKLSFQAGQIFNIYGKPVEEKADLWIAEINGRKGYVPKASVKETQMLHKGKLTLVPSKLPGNPVHEKRNVVKREESVTEAVTPDQVVSSTESYTVIHGTTVPVEPLVTATPTTITTDAHNEMKTAAVDSTSSFFSKYADSNTQSNDQLEMSPISPTIMKKTSEEAGSSSSINDVPSEQKNSNMVDTVVNFMSGFVSSNNEDTEHPKSLSDSPTTEKLLPTDDPSLGEPKTLGGSFDSKGDGTESSEQVNDNKESIIDIPERELEENEDDDDEGDDEEEDDGGGEEEEDEEDDSGDEEPGEEEEELSGDIKSGRELDGGGQRSSVQNVEKTVEVVETTFSVETHGGIEVDTSDMNASFEHDNSENSEVTETASEVHSSTSESTPTDSNSFTEKAMEDKDLQHSPGYHQTLPSAYFPNSETSNTSTADAVDVTFDPTKENSNPGVESSELKSVVDINSVGKTFKNPTDTTDQIEEGQHVTDHRVGEDSDGGIAHEDQLKKDHNVFENEQNVVSPNEEQMPKTEAITSESLLTIHKDNLVQQTFGDTDLKVDRSEDSVTSGEISHSEPTTVNPYHEEITFEDNLVISTPSSGIANEQIISEKDLEQENMVSEKTESGPVTVAEPSDLQSGNDQLGKKELDNEMKNVDETTDKSGSESNLSMSEETSGIFSMIFSPLSISYDYVIDAVFGRSDAVEVISEGFSNVNLVGNSDISDNILNQLDDHKRPQDVEGDVHKGIKPMDHCEANPGDSYCTKSTSNWPSEAERSSEYQESKSWMDNAKEEYQNPFDINNPSYYGALLFSTAVGGMLVCFFLGKYYMEGKKSDAVLVAKLNSLEKKLMVSSTECLILKDKLRNADDSSELIESLRSEVDKLQNEKAHLEKELEVAAEAGLEMDHMVSQCLSSQQACESLMESIEQLRLQANQQQAMTSSLENNLILKTQENETLAQELKTAEEKITELSSQLKEVEADLIQKEEEHHEKYDELRKLYENQKRQFEEDLRNKTVEAVMALTKCTSLEATLNETKDLLAVKENEIAVLQECLEKIKTSNGEDQVAIQFQDMLDFGKLKAELTSVSKERDRLREELQGEEEARKLLEDHVKVIKEEVEKLRKSHEAAEREKAEAQTRLEVLSSYFKEKESQLQKELGAQIQKYTDASSVVQHMKSLEEEVENYIIEQNHSSPQIVDLMDDEPTLELIDVTDENEGSQNETLKKEILDQERGYKSQLATSEKKARENWVAARQAERKLDEAKQEAGQLRNRLTMLSKTAPQSVSQNGDESKQNISVMDSNGELSASPLHMGLASNSSVDSLFLDPNASPPLVSGGVRIHPLIPPPPFPPLPPLPPMSPYHHPISSPLAFVPLPPPEGIYPQSVDGHRPPPLGRMSSPPPPPSPSHSPHLRHTTTRPGKYASPFQDRKGERKSASPPTDVYRGMPIDDRGHMDEWGRYRTPPPHSTHLPDYPPFPYPHPRQHWEDDSMPPTSSFRPLPSQAEAVREKKGGKSKDNHPTEGENLDKANRYGGKQ